MVLSERAGSAPTCTVTPDDAGVASFVVSEITASAVYVPAAVASTLEVILANAAPGATGSVPLYVQVVTRVVVLRAEHVHVAGAGFAVNFSFAGRLSLTIGASVALPPLEPNDDVTVMV